VGLPHLVLIDDSEAILAFGVAVLSPHYAVTTATDGTRGLEEVRRVKPAAVLLDLSMPGIPGEDVLRTMQADALLRDIPVVIVSSERARGEACLAAGAVAFLPKPVRADDMIAMIGRAIEQAKAKRARDGLAIIVVGVGPVEVGIPLDQVQLVTWQPATMQLPAVPSYVAEFFVLRGEAVVVLDLAARLGVEHAVPILERKLLVVEHAGLRLGVCVDRVREPEEIAAADASPIGEAMPIDGVQSVVRTSRGLVPVVSPHALLSRGVRGELEKVLRELAAEPA
jgi:CheY-like chemotaxis protein